MMVLVWSLWLLWRLLLRWRIFQLAPRRLMFQCAPALVVLTVLDLITVVMTSSPQSLIAAVGNAGAVGVRVAADAFAAATLESLFIFVKGE